MSNYESRVVTAGGGVDSTLQHKLKRTKLKPSLVNNKRNSKAKLRNAPPNTVNIGCSEALPALRPDEFSVCSFYAATDTRQRKELQGKRKLSLSD